MLVGIPKVAAPLIASGLPLTFGLSVVLVSMFDLHVIVGKVDDVLRKGCLFP